ncbi:MAG: hypothetical protein LBC60_06375, partial [Spirochaetaceae bacterium]|nr:hypothetical protein [Spirochaetaceae bacterium]
APFTELGTRFGSAQALLQKAQDEEERTPVVTEQCREAFDALEETMRFFKKHYFLIPPLTLSDLVRLGLKVPDTHPTTIPAPTNQVEADLTFPGIHLVELQKIRPVAGPPPDPRSDYGVRIYYGLSGAPSDRFKFRLTEEPKSGSDLPYSIFTRRKKERFDFDGESGSTVYFCLRYENSKGRLEGQGPFGPMLQAVIP